MLWTIARTTMLFVIVLTVLIQQAEGVEREPQSSGLCTSISKEGCQSVRRDLPLKDTKNPAAPAGCIYNNAEQRLNWNENERDDVECSVAYICSCKPGTFRIPYDLIQSGKCKKNFEYQRCRDLARSLNTVVKSSDDTDKASNCIGDLAYGKWNMYFNSNNGRNADCSQLWPCFCEKVARYEFFEEKTSFADAEKDCERRGMHLAHITSKEQNDEMVKLASQTAKKAWIGITDSVTEGTYLLDVTNTAITYSNWKERQPNGGQNQNCVMVELPAGVWNDIKCTNKASYFCEYGKLVPPTVKPTEPPGPPKVPYLFGMQRCFDKCGRKTGSCPGFCYPGGYCCRKGYGGCPADLEEVAAATHYTCTRYRKIHGTWGSWSEFTPCTLQCGIGRHTRTRTCIGPFYYGRPCDGQSSQTLTCEGTVCPGFTEWGNWTPCPACGLAQKYQYRTCTISRCDGPTKKTGLCYTPCRDAPRYRWGHPINDDGIEDGEKR